MKLIKNILLFILLLTFLLLGTVFLCVLNPDLSEGISNTLYGPDSLLFPNAVSNIISNDGTDTIRNNGTNGMSNAVTATDEEASANKDNLPIVNDIEIKDVPGNNELPQSDEYIAPSIENLKVPEEVSGRGGYVEPEGKGQEVTDSEAQDIEDSLGVKETGEDLSFDELYYPFYYMLNDKQKKLYKQVYANANALNDRFSPIEECNSKELKEVMEAVYNDHPELFFVDTAYSFRAKRDGKIIEIDLSFNKTADNLSESKSIFEEAAQSILEGGASLGTAFDKEKYIHDALADKIEYNLNAPMNQSAYSALVNNSTVCAGYARAFQYLCQKMNIPCYYCTGYAGENHAWNIIKLDDNFYNVDVTWDDSYKGNYDYFNKSDRIFNTSHARQSLSVKLPPCNGTGYQVESLGKEDNIKDKKDTSVANENTLEGKKDTTVNNDNSSGNNNNYAGENTSSLPIISNENNVSIDDANADGFDNINDYFADCLKQIVANGKGDYSFSNTIIGNDMLKAWERIYGNEEYKLGYMEEAMKQIGADSCKMSLELIPISNGVYDIIHTVHFE